MIFNIHCAQTNIHYESLDFLKDSSGLPLYCRKVSGDLTKGLMFTPNSKIEEWIFFASCQAGHDYCNSLIACIKDDI
jgi:hypothetical protein